MDAYHNLLYSLCIVEGLRSSILCLGSSVTIIVRTCDGASTE